MKLNYKFVGGRDIYSDRVECICPSKNWIGTDVEHLMKTKITLPGYADEYFFDVVNKEKREVACECGRKFVYQWFRDCVEFEWSKV